MYRSHRVYKEYKIIQKSESKNKDILFKLDASARIPNNGEWIQTHHHSHDQSKRVLNAVYHRIVKTHKSSTSEKPEYPKQELLRMRLFEKTTHFLQSNFNQQWNELGNEKRGFTNLNQLSLMRDYCQLTYR